MVYMYYGDELYHHGILGQKWGVRRYQNYDGSYTQAGLKRYAKAQTAYEDAKANAKSAKTAYKEGIGSKESYKQAKAEVKSTKKKMDSEYEKLPQHKKADEGKKLYAQGKTITDNGNHARIAQTAIIVGSGVAQRVLAQSGDQQLATIAPAVIAVGGTAVNAAIYAKTSSENKKLRAYYAHKS
ncbi:MAG: hypothetical protein LUE29_09780 [Lachnospiraceae bacterium]|nr:hypothetical protein [Lachnospiraceae bacterium]